MTTLKETLAMMDEALLQELVYAAQMALNDDETIQRTSLETGISATRIEAIAGLMIDLSTVCEANHAPEVITTVKELDEIEKNLAALKAEVQG